MPYATTAPAVATASGVPTVTSPTTTTVPTAPTTAPFATPYRNALVENFTVGSVTVTGLLSAYVYAARLVGEYTPPLGLPAMYDSAAGSGDCQTPVRGS